MFIYFDLGNVLLTFDNHRGCQNLAKVTGGDPARIHQVLFEKGLKAQYERGELTPEQYFAVFCQLTDHQGEHAPWELAGSSIFEVNLSIVPVVNQLAAAGHRLGILSNICPSHWKFVSSGQYGLIRDNFSVHALSYEIGVMKPNQAIYRRAAELAGVRPSEIFYCDDLPANVTAAQQAGYDAVLYTTTPAYVADLNRRGLLFNY